MLFVTRILGGGARTPSAPHYPPHLTRTAAPQFFWAISTNFKKNWNWNLPTPLGSRGMMKVFWKSLRKLLRAKFRWEIGVPPLTSRPAHAPLSPSVASAGWPRYTSRNLIFSMHMSTVSCIHICTGNMNDRGINSPGATAARWNMNDSCMNNLITIMALP